MASTGKQAWEKHFRGKGNIETTMKKESSLFDSDGKSVGKIGTGQKIVFLETKEYNDKTPIEYNGNQFFVTFNNIQKPKSKLVSGIKLKPQDYTFFTQETWGAKDLAQRLVDETEERKDLDPTLKTYITTITKYWGKIENVTTTEISKLKTPDRGLNEIKKDYGEMLGAIACVTHKILAKDGIQVSNQAKLNFPLRGNEPIVDYYIIDGRKKHSVSAKSGSTTNTLKAADIISLLKSKGEYSKWQNRPITKLIKAVAEVPTAQFPFQTINMIAGKKILSDAALKEASDFKVSSFNKNDYNQSNFQALINLISVPGNVKKPTIGQLFYFTEKYIVEKANSISKYDPTDIFAAATEGMVIYVKYDITGAAKQGNFNVMIPAPNTDAIKKKIKWRSKNSQNRAADKIGVQP